MVADSPIQERGGILLKREDLCVGPFGVNGSKWRTWESVVAGLPEDVLEVVVAGSVHAPTVPIGAVACALAEVPCTIIVGGTTPEKALRHHYIQIVREAGAEIEGIPVGYAPALKKAARTFQASRPGVWVLAPPDPVEAGEAELHAFLDPVGEQAGRLPEGIETLVIPFGSGNTAAGILYGLATHGAPSTLERVVLVGIGPDRWDWLHSMLNAAGVGLSTVGEFPFELEHLQTHPWFAQYGDRMPESLGDIDLHPTYEGKVVRYLNLLKPDWWRRKDGSTCLWIVGGPF